MRLLLIAEKSLVTPIKKALAQESVTVDTLARGEQIDKKLKANDYEALLVDQNQLKEPCAPRIASWRSRGLTAFILVLPGENSNGMERIACLDAGADACLHRPLSPEELRAQLSVFRRRSKRPHSGVQRIHDLEIDTLKRVVSRDGKPIRLTSQEFDLLKLLASRPGKVINRSMILQQLYGHREAPASNVVDVYIRYLRNKIDKDSEKPLILTRWGQGYLLRDEDEVEE